MTGLRRTCIALLLLGLAAGTLLNRGSASEPRRLGGYRVLEADLHVHAFPGDGWLPPYGLIREAGRRGLHAFALTNHNQVSTARVARRISRALGGPVVLVGQEITSPDYHIVAVGIEHVVDWRQSAAQAIADTHAQGGVAIAAHPKRRFFPALTTVLESLDGGERMHPLIYGNPEEAADLSEFHRLGNRRVRPWATIGSSDYHAFNALGVTRTLVFARSLEPSAIVEALRAGRTVVRDETGAFMGDEAMIRLLEAAPPDDAAAIDYGYHGSGTLDVVTRSWGWLGLLGLILLRRRT